MHATLCVQQHKQARRHINRKKLIVKLRRGLTLAGGGRGESQGVPSRYKTLRAWNLNSKRDFELWLEVYSPLFSLT